MVSIYSVHEPLDLNDGGTPPDLNRVLSERYGVQTLLGAGRTSRVYEARVFPSGEQVAVKILREHCNTNENTQRLKWESALLSRIDSHYFPRFVDFGVCNKSAYMVTEPFHGQTLAKILNDYARLSLFDALDVGIQLAEALEYLHSHNVVHASFNTTDLILMRRNQRYCLKLVDLDSTTNLSSQAPQQIAMFGEGTCFEYMSPEQANGEPVDPRTDVYVFGLIFYEMLTGRRPFFGSTAIELLNNRFARKPESVAGVINDIEFGDALDRAFAALLSPDRRGRLKNMTEVRKLLQSYWLSLTGNEYKSCMETDTICDAQENAPQEVSSQSSWIHKVIKLFRPNALRKSS